MDFGIPKEEEPNPIIFLNNKTSSFNKLYEQINSNPEISLESFPQPKHFDSYKKYEKAAQAWRRSVFDELKNAVLPLPPSMKYNRPPMPMTKEMFKMTKFNPKQSMLNSSNLSELLDLVIEQDFIPDKDRNFEKPVVGSKHAKISDHLIEDAWNQALIPQEPMPQLFDSFEDYKRALLQWKSAGDNKKLPMHPKEFIFEHADDECEIYQYKNSYTIPPMKFLEFLRAGRQKDTFPIDFLHEIYRQNVLFYIQKKKDKNRGWLFAMKKRLSQEKSQQSDELCVLMEKKSIEIDDLINFGPEFDIPYPHPLDYSEVGLQVDTNLSKIKTREDFIYNILFPEISLKSVRLVIERNAPLFDCDSFSILMQLCKECVSKLSASKIALLVDVLFCSDRKENYIDLLISNRDYMQIFGMFIGKYGFIPNTPPICYSLPLDADVSFGRSYTFLILSGLLFSVSQYFPNEVPMISSKMTKHFHLTAEVVQLERATIFRAFSESEEVQTIAYHVIILAMSISYRPFHSAIFSPSPINAFYAMLDNDLPHTVDRVRRLMLKFEAGSPIKSVFADLIQFDIGLVSKKADILVPLTKKLLNKLSRSTNPILTRTQIMAQSKAFSIKLAPKCYTLLESIADIFCNKNVFFMYSESDMIKDRSFICKMIIQIILQSETSIIDSLFGSMKKLIFNAQWQFPKQFWMVFVAALWRDDPVQYNCWDFLAKIFELSMSSILPDFFEDQVTTIFKPGTYKYCLQIYKFLAEIINYPEITVIEEWFANSEGVLRHTFSRIFSVIGNERDNSECMKLYKSIMKSTIDWETHKYGHSFISIIRNETFEKNYVKKKK